MYSENENCEFKKSCISSVIVCAFTLCIAIIVAVSVPVKEEIKPTVEIVTIEEKTETTPDFGAIMETARLESDNTFIGNTALDLYRQPESRSAVEWFYLHVTGNKDVSLSILEEAEKNNIPLSLAFALAYTESRYNANAVNKNKNSSIDRGLFQLNNNSFPNLKEADFFDPAISAKYGMSHLRFCMNVAGNEITALAMYNAGTTKVRANNTPQTTLNYVGKIMEYREKLDKLFAEEVGVFYDSNRSLMGIPVAYAGNKR